MEMGVLVGLAGVVLAAGAGGAGASYPARAVVTVVAKRSPGPRAADVYRLAARYGTVPLGLAEPAAVRRPVWW